MTDYRQKYKESKRRIRDLEKQVKLLYRLISKISIQIHIENNPVNTNDNRLINMDPGTNPVCDELPDVKQIAVTPD